MGCRPVCPLGLGTMRGIGWIGASRTMQSCQDKIKTRKNSRAGQELGNSTGEDEEVSGGRLCPALREQVGVGQCREPSGGSCGARGPEGRADLDSKPPRKQCIATCR